MFLFPGTKLRYYIDIKINLVLFFFFFWNVLLGITLVSNLIELDSDNTLTLLRLMTQ